MPDAGDLYDLARAILEAGEDSLAEAGLQAHEISYVSNGLVAFDGGEDCGELLAVEVNRAYIGLPAAEQAGDTRPVAYTRAVDFTLWDVRCVPVVRDDGTGPSDEEIETSAQVVLADGWALFRGLLARRKDLVLGTACDSLSIGPLEPHGPDGGRGGWKLTVRASL